MSASSTWVRLGKIPFEGTRGDIDFAGAGGGDIDFAGTGGGDNNGGDSTRGLP